MYVLCVLFVADSWGL